MPRISRRQVLLNVVAIAFVAIGLPAFLGLGLLSALVVIPLASLSVFLVADLTAESFPRLDRRNFARKISACVLTGWAGGIAILCAGLLAMNAMFWTGSLLLPPGIVMTDALELSLAASVLVAGVALMVSRRTSSASTAKLALKLILVMVTLGSLYGCNKAQSEGWFLPTTERISKLTWIAAAFFLANGAALLALAYNALPMTGPARR
jgi:hypothetical protein